jgi:hypothetical protein
LDGVWSSRESVNVPKVYLSNKSQSVRGLLVNRHIGPEQPALFLASAPIYWEFFLRPINVVESVHLNLIWGFILRF